MHDGDGGSVREALKAFGATEEQIDAALPDDECLVLPENETVLAVFMAMQSQWRVGMGGPIGLDYAALPVVFEALKVGKKKRRDAFQWLRIMENEALRIFGEKRNG